MEDGQSMVDKDKLEFSGKEKLPEEFQHEEGELLHDYEGKRYLVNDDYLKRQKELRRNSRDKSIELKLAHNLLESNLRQLTKKQRDVMYYTMLKMSQSEIAKTMGISLNAVKQHLNLARKKLVKIITGTKQILKEGLDNESNTID